MNLCTSYTLSAITLCIYLQTFINLSEICTAAKNFLNWPNLATLSLTFLYSTDELFTAWAWEATTPLPHWASVRACCSSYS